MRILKNSDILNGCLRSVNSIIKMSADFHMLIRIK